MKKAERFEVELYEVNNGGLIGKINKTVVNISDDEETSSILEDIVMQTLKKIIDLTKTFQSKVE